MKGLHLRYKLAVTASAILCAASVALAVALMVQGSPLFGCAVLVFGGVWAATVVLGIEGRLRQRKRGAAPIEFRQPPGREPHIAVPYSPIMYYGYGAVMASMALFFAFCAAGAALAEPNNVGLAVLLCVGVAVFGSLPLFMALGSFALGRIEIYPHGVYQRGWTFESYMPWQSVAHVAARFFEQGPTVYITPMEGDQSYRRRQIHSIWKQDKLPRHEWMEIPARNLDADGPLVYRMIGYYFQNPEARAELATQAPVQRAQSDAFPYPPVPSTTSRPGDLP